MSEFLGGIRTINKRDCATKNENLTRHTDSRFAEWGVKLHGALILMKSSPFRLALVLLSGAVVSNAGITFTCDPTINATVPGLCNTLQTTTAGIYNNTFSNINANVYVTFGATGLGSSSGFDNFVPYSTYVSAATANANGSTVQTAAAAALKNNAAPIYTGNVKVSAAQGLSLGFPGMTGITSTSANCELPATGCYVGIITMSNTASFYYRTGTIAPTAYDFFTTFEHEVNEVLGTSSCTDTSKATLMNSCGPGIPAAVDLFRYSAPGKLIPVSSLSTAPGAYFSYDGTNNVAPNLFFNTLSNGNDYADFISADCGSAGPFYVQNGTGCPGGSPGLDITNDGNVEINTLNALGYTLTPVAGLPAVSASGVVTTGLKATTAEPGSWVTIYGTNLAPTTTNWSNAIVNGNLPTSLGGVSVSINGKAAYIYYISPTQLNVQAPDDAATGQVNVTVTTPTGTSAPATVTLASVSPAFFTLDGKYVAGVIPSATGAYLPGTPNSYDLVGPTGMFPYSTRPVKKGEIVALYMTGFGAGSPAVAAGKVVTSASQTIYPVSLSIGGVVVSGTAYITGAGLYQMNITIPATAASGDNILQATVNGVQSQTGVYITVQ